MNINDNARQLLSREIVHDFIGRITGAHYDRIVGADPEDKILVGKLMSTADAPSDRSSQTFTGSSQTFIDSIGLDFYISEQDMETAELTLIPRGYYYYRVLPTLDEMRDAFLKRANSILGRRAYNSFSDIVTAYNADNKAFDNISAVFLPVYKKIRISKDDAAIKFMPRDLLTPGEDCGFAGEDHRINLALAEYLASLQEQMTLDSEIMRYEINEQVRVRHLLSADTFSSFIQSFSDRRVERQFINRKLYFDIQIKKTDNKYLVSVFLVNNSVSASIKPRGSKAAGRMIIDTLFNSGIYAKLEKASFCPFELDYFRDDYKYDRRQYAVSNNCSAEYIPAENALRTVHLPLYEQYRLKTNDSLAVKFDDLAADPVGVLEDILKKMKTELTAWRNYKAQIESTLSETGKSRIESEIQGFEDETANFEQGIEVIKYYPDVKKSFVQMNKAFSASSDKYKTWRLFQAVFIVSVIPDITACDPSLMPDDEKVKTHLSSMSLLYFPTGGGKTEAFLGALVFNIFFDRYRGKSFGVTAILRYPLRLLSVQQVQRLANVFAKAEMIRRSDAAIEDTECFSLGYYVGDNNTPNSMKPTDFKRYREMTPQQRDEHRIIDICPFCRKKTVHIKTDENALRLIHYCDNQDCESGGDLPLYIVDNEIYRYLPTALISTVDKLAIMGCNANFRNILSGARCKCPVHGFTSRGRCTESGCKVNPDEFINVVPYDPAPTLFIQDELHLIRESLGTYASHYESFLKYFIRNLSPSRRDVKVIGATATISSYRSQVYHLYGREPIRFPCASPYEDKNFYAQVDYSDLQRQILGFAPYGKAVINSVVYSLKYMRETIFEYCNDPQKVLSIPGIGITDKDQALEILKDYWIFLEYNNVKRDGNKVSDGIEAPVNEELAAEGIPVFRSRAMTGDESFQDVREVLAEVENNADVYNGINLITATSMISHGVDADRFNVMFFYGIPGNMAEYIQAYSRTGRRYPGIVIDLIRPTRETDQSYLKEFVNMHRFKDLLVEPVPINRWASKAADCTLPGIFTSLLLTFYDPICQENSGSLFFMKNIKNEIKNLHLDKERVREQLYLAYGCTEDDGIINELGNQYREKIDEFTDDIFSKIADRGWDKESIFEGFILMGYRIMRSLRDTDSHMILELI